MWPPSLCPGLPTSDPASHLTCSLSLLYKSSVGLSLSPYALPVGSHPSLLPMHPCRIPAPPCSAAPVRSSHLPAFSLVSVSAQLSRPRGPDTLELGGRQSVAQETKLYYHPHPALSLWGSHWPLGTSVSPSKKLKSLEYIPISTLLSKILPGGEWAWSPCHTHLHSGCEPRSAGDIFTGTKNHPHHHPQKNEARASGAKAMYLKLLFHPTA